MEYLAVNYYIEHFAGTSLKKPTSFLLIYVYTYV
jgi:hypothetical protein